MTSGEHLRLLDELYALRQRIKHAEEELLQTDNPRREYKLQMYLYELHKQEDYLRYVSTHY